MNWKTTNPAIQFLGWFLGIYIIGNLAYGLYIELLFPSPDIFTRWVSFLSSYLLNVFGHTTSAEVQLTNPTVLILESSRTILRIYEGCNGINVFIVFLAFIVAFGGNRRRQVAYILMGIGVIYLANLGRIMMLFWIAKDYKQYFYYVHKYFFTAVLYLVVGALWAGWVYLNLKNKPS